MDLLSLSYLSQYHLCHLIRRSEMFDKEIGKIIPFRITISWRRDRSVVPLHVPPAADRQLSTRIPSANTSQGLSFRNFSDGVQITLPVVQAVVAAVPGVGGQLVAAISGFLAVVKVMDTSIQNRQGLDDLTRRLCTLSRRIANAPTIRTSFEEENRRELIRVLDETAMELLVMQRRIPGSPHVTQDINGCFSEIDRALIDFTAFSLMERPEVMRIPLTRTVVVVDATGEEHNMLLEHCCSFEQLRCFLPVLLGKCQPGKAHIQKWYIDRGDYDFVIDNGTSVVQLTRESAIWSIIQPGTRIVMRIIITEFSRRFPRVVQCHCGTWHEVEAEEAELSDGSNSTIMCYSCHRRFQITGKRVSAKQLEETQYTAGPTVETKNLIRNFLRKQVMEGVAKMPSDQLVACVVCGEEWERNFLRTHFWEAHVAYQRFTIVRV